MTTESYNNPSKELLYRYEKTMEFIDKLNLNLDIQILDIGTKNPFTFLLKEKGYKVENSGKIDLDLNPKSAKIIYV